MLLFLLYVMYIFTQITSLIVLRDRLYVQYFVILQCFIVVLCISLLLLLLLFSLYIIKQIIERLPSLLIILVYKTVLLIDNIHK